LQTNIETLGASDQSIVVRADALRFIENLEPFAYDLAVADPPYGQGLAEALADVFLKRPFAHALWVEHGASETLPESEHMRTRRYGDTAITLILADE
jgi:16S rRNA G966 N2-methylase RsmD